MREPNPPILEALYQNWCDLVQPFTTDQVVIQHAFQELVAAYSAYDRSYHTLSHIQHFLKVVEFLKSDFLNLTAVSLAGWFHDVVYDSQRQDNEYLSTLSAGQTLLSLKIPTDVITEVQRLILLTQSHQTTDKDYNGQVVLDADLAILGTPPERYQIYVQQIRQEYAWLSEGAFQTGRILFLQNLLQRDRIYQTPQMQQTAELQARTNLTIEFEFRESRAKV